MSQSQVEVMLRGYAGLNRRDLDALTADWAEDIVFTFPGDTRLSGVHHGKTDAERCFWILQQVMPDVQIVVLDVIDGPDVVMVEWVKRSTGPDGQVFENPGLTVAEFQGEQVVVMRDYLDTIKLSNLFQTKPANPRRKVGGN